MKARNATAPESAEVVIEEGRPVPARARALRVAREGFTGLAANQEINDRKLSLARYRACKALLWPREQILEETGWSLQYLMSVERVAREEDREQLQSGADPVDIFAEYREAQLLAARELEDLAQIFRNSKQFSALVGAVKARSEILDKIIKTGQELGLIKRAAKEVHVRGKVDYEKLSIKELRVTLRREVDSMQRMIRGTPGERLPGPAAAVLRRVLPAVTEPPAGEVVEVPPEEPAAPPRGPRVKKLR